MTQLRGPIFNLGRRLLQLASHMRPVFGVTRTYDDPRSVGDVGRAGMFIWLRRRWSSELGGRPTCTDDIVDGAGVLADWIGDAGAR